MNDKEKQVKEGQNKIYYVLSKFDPTTPIYRYLDFDFLLSFLSKERLDVPMKYTFSDSHESTLPVSHFFGIRAVGNGAIETTSAKNDILRQKWNEYKEESGILTSCWTIRQDENYLMWKAYSSKMGVRIKTTINDFVSSIKTDDYDILCSEIAYSGHKYGADLEEQIFSKDSFYSNEEEIRFYFYPTNKDKSKGNSTISRINIPFCPKDLIQEIILSPFIDCNATDAIKELLEEKYTYLQGKIKKSKIKIKGNWSIK